MQRTILARTFLARPLSTSARRAVAANTSPQDPNTPNTPASQTTGNPPTKTADAGAGDNSTSGGKDMHLAKEADPQEKPTRSTGIGNQGSVEQGENKK